MSDIVSNLKKLGNSNSIDMSGRHTIAECLNAFGGNDRREISKALNGAVKPIAIPLLRFSAMATIKVSTIWVKFSNNDTFLKLYSGKLYNGSNATYSFKNACFATLPQGEYKFTSNIPVSGNKKGLLLCDATNNSVIAYANANYDCIFSFLGSDKNVYLKLDIDGPLDCITPIRCDFKLIQTQ